MYNNTNTFINIIFDATYKLRLQQYFFHFTSIILYMIFDFTIDNYFYDEYL